MTVRMGTVWDGAVDVAQGRAGILAPIAAGTLFAPSVIQNAFIAYAPTAPALVGLVSILVALVSLWGQLQIIAVAFDPSTDAARARGQATARLLPSIGVGLVIGLIAVVAALPLVVMLVAAGMRLTPGAITNPALMTPPSPGVAAVAGLYALAFVLAAIALGARLMPSNAVVLNERRGVGAIARSFALTRGLTWRLIGVTILFGIVFLVATLAAQGIVGVVLRLALGPDNIATATFLAAVVGAAVSATLFTLAYVFIARFYALLTGRVDDERLAETFE